MGREELEEPSQEEVRERDLVEAYLHEHTLEQSLNDVINQVVAERPDDPFLVLSRLLYAKATNQRGITHIQVVEVVDAMGFPGVLVRVHTGKGIFEASSGSWTPGLPDQVPSSDDNPVPLSAQRFGGRGYRRRCEKAQALLLEKLVEMEPTDQAAIDAVLMMLEPEIGRNICIATSMAICKSGAQYAELPLQEYIAKLLELPLESMCVPMPVFSVVNGGKCASNKLFVQEILAMPTSAASFSDALQIGIEFNMALRNQLEARGVGFSNTGTFGGFAPQLQTLNELFQILRAAFEDVRVKYETMAIGLQKTSVSPLIIDFGIDVSADAFLVPQERPATAENDGELDRMTLFSYNLDQWVPGSAGAIKSSDELLDTIRRSIKDFNLMTIVDPFASGDLKSFTALFNAEHDQDDGRQTIGGDPNCRLQVVAKKLIDVHGLESVQQERASNTLALHLPEFVTISHALEVLVDARRMGMAILLGMDAGNMNDGAFLAAFAVGAGIGQVKLGGLVSAECLERYNQLLLLAQDPLAPAFVATSFRR